MLYTRKGDDGSTKTFACDQRISKSSAVSEALGTLDETNSFLGLCKVKVKDSGFKIQDLGIDTIVHSIQENLFIVQAEVAGADKHISQEKVIAIEELVNIIEKILPPIKTFFISGGTELAALFDYARTLSRRAERRVVAVFEEGKVKISPEALAYLNRLSSLLYAITRLSNHLSGINEVPPSYK